MINYTQQDYERDVAIVKGAPRNTAVVDEAGGYFDDGGNALTKHGEWSLYDVPPAQPSRSLSDIKALIAAFEREQERQWISVEDRLPKENTDVLAVWWAKAICVSYYSRGEWWYVDKDGLQTAKVKPTHWAPLPQLPQEGEL